MRMAVLTATLCVIVGAREASADGAFTIHDAIIQATQTHPAVAEAAANRRATEAEMRETQGTLLPQVRLQVEAGPERLNRAITPPPLNNNQWARGREASVVIRQLLFDGFASINEIWRRAARVDAAAYRVHERTELTALDAAEAYIDVARFLRLVALAQDNVAAHRRILDHVRARFSGGRSGEGDFEQARERVSSAEAVLAEFRLSLDEARAKYRRAVGIEPHNLRFPGRLTGLAPSKDEALAIAVRHNPTLRAAGADTEAARYGFEATAGAFLPQASLEARHVRGADSITYPDYRTEQSVKLQMSWDLFNGGRDSWRRAEAAERMIESSQREARLRRDAFESIDKAWAARTITSDRIASLTRELASARKVVEIYGKEYELGQRTLVDLLNAENIRFNAAVSLVSARGVAVFADYQLLATLGQLMAYLRTAPPPEAAPMDPYPLAIFPARLPPILIRAPAIGPAPARMPGTDSTAAPPDVIHALSFSERWPGLEAATRGGHPFEPGAAGTPSWPRAALAYPIAPLAQAGLAR
jgi:outer membrane protein, adhesin transport system